MKNLTLPNYLIGWKIFQVYVHLFSYIPRLPEVPQIEEQLQFSKKLNDVI